MQRKTIFIISLVIIALLMGGYLKMTGKTISNNPKVLMKTSLGEIEIELYPNKSPITVENFLEYVKEKTYDETVFHRVIKNFMIQGGGFAMDGDEKETNFPIKLESNNGLSNKEYTIAMARTNIPDSATNQFFINTADNDFLNYAPGNPGYAVFGKVTKGSEVVEKIQKSETTTKHGMQDWPVKEIIIESIRKI